MDHLLGDMSQELITFVFQKAACKRFRVAMCSIWLQTVCSLFVIVPEETMCHYRLKLICNSNLPAWLPTRARLGMQSHLVLDALVGKRREALFNAVDRQLETHVGTSTILADKPCNPDILWTKVATALQAATERDLSSQTAQTL